ncbi:MAG: DUF86 domain-containing protein [Gloeocapsa sp. UFS-A4-WI-NPMV-4B04]|nr:DUF86 domain-containing protein [Gloeocapsa sp. UFS-A4-WI-NPMV-4B04]
MSKIDNLSRLLHMRDAAIEAIDFASGRRRDELNTNRMLTLALVKDIEIIGEAASRISAECRARHPQLPWVQIIGMRNRLTHAYFEVNLDIVWQVVTNDLPALVIKLEQIISLEA